MEHHLPGTRINVELPKEQYDRLKELLPWGMKSLLFRSLIAMTLEAVDKGGPEVLGLILNKQYNPLIKELNLEDKVS